MFTGIIETIGQIAAIEKEGTNVHFTVQSTLAPQLKIDQSVSHNGVCLTVVALEEDRYVVTAIEETLIRSNLGRLEIGDAVNLERAMQSGARLDGHMVQGHVDSTGICTGVEKKDGSWYFHFEYDFQPAYMLVDKGSVCINGVSLTVVNPSEGKDKKARFSVAIIPFTFDHTNFGKLKKGDAINLEFDVIGKYVAKYMQLYSEKCLQYFMG